MRADGTMVPDSKLGRIAGQVFEDVDQFIGKLGNPVGLKSYKPFPFLERRLSSQLSGHGPESRWRSSLNSLQMHRLCCWTEQARFDPGDRYKDQEAS